MDTLSHGLLGAAIGQGVFGRKLGWRATVIGVVAAELPDLDFFLHSTSDPLLNIELHRHFTHSFAFAPVIAVLATSPWLLRSEFKPHRLALLLCGLAGCCSHILLDACTSYGTQFLVPFSQHRFGWDFISIIDPVFTLVLMCGLVVNLCLRRRSSAESDGSNRPVWIALAICFSYLALGAWQKVRAQTAQASLARSRGHRIVRSEVMPTLANQLVWRSLYLHGGRIHSDRLRVSWFGAATVRLGDSLPLVTALDLTPTEAVRIIRHDSFARFTHLTDGWVARAPGDPTVIGDMRYSLSTRAFDPIWGIRFTPPGAHTEIEWVNRSRSRSLSLAELWSELIGAHAEYRPLPRIPLAN